jgi:hypothetical protein
MSGNPDKSLTIDTHHHILPDFFWQETENANALVGGLAPLRWSEEASIFFMDDAGQGICQEFHLREITGQARILAPRHHLSKRLDRQRRLL